MNETRGRRAWVGRGDIKKNRESRFVAFPI